MAVIAALALGGCAAGASAPSNAPAAGFVPGELNDAYSGTTITVAMPTWNATPASLLADFTEKTGITVDMQDAGGDYNAMHDKFVTTAAAGQSMGDVIELGFDWVGQFGAAGWLTPLDGFIADDTVSDTVGSDAFVYDGDLLGVPYNVDFRGSIANMTMFEKAGITTPPETWAEVIEDAKKIKAAGVAEYPIGLPLSITEGTSTVWYALQRSSGGEVLSSAGDALFAEGNVGVDSLQFIQDLVADGLVDPGSVNLQQVDVNDQFSAGANAFLLAGAPGNLIGFANPAESTISNDDLRFIHLPGEKDNTGVTLNFNEALAIPAASKNKEAAAMFIAWRSTLDSYIDTYLEPTNGSVPPTEAAITELADTGQLLGAQQIIDVMGNVGPLIIDGPPTWYGNFSDAAAALIQDVALGNQEPAAGVAQLKEQVNKLAGK